MNTHDLARLASLFKAIPLPEFSFASDQSEGSEDNPGLQAYWRHYGFDTLLKRHRVRYHIGRAHMHDYQLVCHYWRPPRPLAHVVVVHGLFDHVGLYLKLVDALLCAGYAVVAVDLPGHGLSEGEATAIPSFNDYSGCLAELLTRLRAHDHLPVFAVGQSTGGAVIANHVLSSEAKEDRIVSAIVLLSPLIYPRKWHLVRCSYCLLSPFLQRIKRNFTAPSHDADFCRFLATEDPLQSRYLSVSWVRAMMQWIHTFASLPVSSLPALIIQGDRDMTVDASRNVPLYKSKLLAANALTIAGAGHQLVNELQSVREQVFSSMLEFLSSQRLSVHTTKDIY